MFCAPFCVPLPPALPFGALVHAVLPGLYGEHPEFELIDWQRVEWFESGKRFRPDFGKSLEHHGLAHKTLDPLSHAGADRHPARIEPGQLAF